MVSDTLENVAVDILRGWGVPMKLATLKAKLAEATGRVADYAFDREVDAFFTRRTNPIRKVSVTRREECAYLVEMASDSSRAKALTRPYFWQLAAHVLRRNRETERPETELEMMTVSYARRHPDECLLAEKLSILPDAFQPQNIPPYLTNPTDEELTQSGLKRFLNGEVALA